MLMCHPPRPMRTVYDVRRDNLRALFKTWGGPTSLAGLIYDHFRLKGSLDEGHVKKLVELAKK